MQQRDGSVRCITTPAGTPTTLSKPILRKGLDSAAQRLQSPKEIADVYTWVSRLYKHLHLFPGNNSHRNDSNASVTLPRPWTWLDVIG